MIAKPEEKKDVVVEQGIVFYTDGGCRPNPGKGGWGFHGYLYSAETPKNNRFRQFKGTTAIGYDLNHKEDNQDVARVTPLNFVDGFGSFDIEVTNNAAEVVAVAKALEYAKDFAVSRIHIRTDSEYAIKGFKSLDLMASRGWLKADGSPFANTSFLKEMKRNRDVLTQRGVEIDLSWIKGHNDDTGNTIADQMATFGVTNSRRGKYASQIDRMERDMYWNVDVNKHPFFGHRFMYFNTNPEYWIKGEYYIGADGKEMEMLGKKTSEGAYAVLRLKEEEPILEFLKRHQSSICEGSDSLIVARLDALFNPDFYKLMDRFGEVTVSTSNPYRKDLFRSEDNPGSSEPITREMKPARIATRAVDAINDISKRLDAYLAKDIDYIVTDLTDILYEKVEKPSKKKNAPPDVSIRLKAEYNVGFASMEVQARHFGPERSIAVSPITLTLGVDLLDRNSLKRLEDREPRVSLLVWHDSEKLFRYATVIETNTGDVGIWSGHYSNVRLIS